MKQVLTVAMKAVLTAVCMLWASGASGALVFEDDFDLDPAATGSIGRSGGSATPVTKAWAKGTSGGTASISQETVGSNTLARFDHQNDVVSVVDRWIQRSVSTAGFTGLTLQLWGDQQNTDWESEDFIEIAYSLNGGTSFTPIEIAPGDSASPQRDNGPIFGDPPTVGSAGGGGANIKTTGVLSLPAAMDDQSNLILRIYTSSNVNSEDYLIDRVTINGVPEPASALLLGLAAMAVIRRR